MTKRTTTSSDPHATSESEEMYLIHIAMAHEEGIDGPVPLRKLSDMLSVTPVSANQMVKKLADRRLVEYIPYRGASLTPDGQSIANRVLRRRRLWALFLSEEVGLAPAEADAIACDLEHVTPSHVADRLSEMLGDPRFGPTGRPIPSGQGITGIPSAVPLASIAVNETCTLVEAGDPSLRNLLHAEGIHRGTDMVVTAASSSGAMLVESGRSQLHLAAGSAERILVQPGSPS